MELQNLHLVVMLILLADYGKTLFIQKTLSGPEPEQGFTTINHIQAP